MPIRRESGRAYTPPRRTGKRKKTQAPATHDVGVTNPRDTQPTHSPPKRRQVKVRRRVQHGIRRRRRIARQQPGVYTDAQRRKVERHKRSRSYRKTVREIRRRKVARAQERYRQTQRPGVFTDAERRKVTRHKRTRSYRKAVNEIRQSRYEKTKGPGPFTDRERRKVEAFKRSGTQERKRLTRQKNPSKAGTYRGGIGGKKVAGSSVDITTPARLATTPYQVARATVEDPEAVGKATAKSLKDMVVNIPSSAIKTVTDPKAAAKEIVADYKRRYGPLVEGDSAKFRKRLKKEGVAAEVLDTAAVASVQSRALTIGARTIRKAKPRPDREAPGTTIRQRQRHPKGIVGGAVASAKDKRGERAAKKQYRKAEEAQARGASQEEVNALKAKGARKDPRRVDEGEIRKRQDERADLAERRRRHERDEEIGGLRRARESRKRDRLKRGRKERGRRAGHQRSASVLVAQGIVKADRESIRAYRDRISAESLESPAKAAANKRLKKELDDIYKDKKVDYGEVQRLAKAYAEIVKPLQADLVARGILDAKQAEMAKLIPYAVAEMGARWRAPEVLIQKERPAGMGWRRTTTSFGKETAWRREGRVEIDGRSLKSREIYAHMRQNDVDPDAIAWVSQAPNTNRPGAYYMAWNEPKGISGRKRTGEATAQGTFDIDDATVEAGVAGMVSLRVAHNEYAEFVKETGYRKNGKIQRFKTKAEADQAIRDLEASPAEAGGKLTPATYKWRAVPVNPTFGKKRQGDSLIEQANDLMDDGRSVEATKAVEQALEGNGEGRYVLVLDAAADQQVKHLRNLNPTAGGRALRQGGRLFRGAVLTTSTTWPTGNIIEGLVRAGVSKAGPLDAKFARAVSKRLDELDPAMAAEFRHRVSQGHFGIEDMQAIHTTAEHFNDSPRIAALARTLGTIRRAPGAKQIANIWGSWTRTVFGVNGAMEHFIKQAMAGQALHEFRVSKRDLVNWNKAVDDAARGLLDTNAQVEVARWVRRAYGKYEAFSPSQRFIISHFTPFAAWAINAVNFLAHVLPKDHPVLTAVLAANSRAWEEWRQDEALDLLPGFLQGSYPSKDGLIRIGRYTPFAVAGNPSETIGRLVIPQFSGAILATLGVDWKLDPLGDEERPTDVSEGERIKGVLAALAGAFIPGVNPAKKIKEKGVGGLNPFDPSPRQKPGVTKGFARKERLEKLKDELPGKISEGTAGKREVRAHKKLRRVNERIYRESKGEYGTKYKEPFSYKPKGKRDSNPFAGSTGGGGESNPFKGKSSSSGSNPFKN